MQSEGTRLDLFNRPELDQSAHSLYSVFHVCVNENTVAQILHCIMHIIHLKVYIYNTSMIFGDVMCMYRRHARANI